MSGFSLNPFVFAIVMLTLTMGAIGAFIILPIAAIEWSWNALAHVFSVVPVINSWQSGLLYIAGVLILYISGIIKIEVKANFQP